MWTDTHLFSCCVRPQRLLISTTAHVNGHTLVQLLCTATETPHINYSSCERTHTCSAAVYGHRDSSYQLQLMWTDTHLFSCCVRPQRLLISTTAHVNGHTLVRLLCTATETPNINYSSCERTHTCSAVVYGHRDSSYQLQLMWTDTHSFGCCVRPQRLLISTTAHVNGHTLVQLLCTATETPNINYSSCEQTHTCSAVVYGHRDS